MNKTNRRTKFQFYWYYESTSFGQPFCPSSGVLSRTSALVHFMQFWWPFATRSRKELQFLPAKNSWWWAERLPGTCNTNKIEIQCVCWFHLQGICHDARSYDIVIDIPNSSDTGNEKGIRWDSTSAIYSEGCRWTLLLSIRESWP